MATNALYCTIVVGFVLAGCGPETAPPPPITKGPCNPASHACNVKISIVDCVPTPDPEPIPIAVQPAEIHWRIDPASAQAGYTFDPQNGIVPTDDQDQQFSKPPNPNPSPTQFHWNDKNTNKTRYKYTINVKRDGSACKASDPFIANGQ
jgi:hypothetical protein